ncbi:hypothetical protein [Streptomyces sp. NPDC051993]|uniref:hypothetical protein n=1 Tax=Streptomyces sp. NPDC051993 TaxID=3155286 RepID=UPI003434D09F
MEPYFRARPIGSVKAKDIQAWLVWMVEERGYALSTAYGRYGFSAGSSVSPLPTTIWPRTRAGRCDGGTGTADAGRAG